MFGWLKKRRYHDEVMSNVLALTVMFHDGAVSQIESMLPGLRDHIDAEYAEDTDPYLLAVNVAAIVMTEAIELMDPSARQRSADQITRLINGENVEEERENLVTRYLIMHSLAKSWEDEGRIDAADRDRLEHEVYGALLGLDREERSKQRMASVLNMLVEQEA